MTTGVLVYLSSCYALHRYSYSQLYKIQPPSYHDGSLKGLTKFKMPTGELLSGLYLKHPDAKHTILFHHGNRADIGRCLTHCMGYYERGYSVFVYDYPGYGTSEGTPSQKSLYKSSLSAYQHLVENLNIPAKSIIILGRSLGGGPATYLASQLDTGALILESTFTSAYKTRLPMPFLGDKFQNIKQIKNVHIPLLLIHGTADHVTPFSHALKLYQSAGGKKFFYWIKDAGHHDYQDSSQYWAYIEAFNQWLKSPLESGDNAEELNLLVHPNSSLES